MRKMTTLTVIYFVLVPDKNYILQIMKKDNEKDDHTDSDKFCLGYRQNLYNSDNEQR